jgi:hypothetical protein
MPLTILERPLAEFSGFLLEFLNGTLIDTTTLVDQVTGGGRLARINVANDCDGGKIVVDGERISSNTHRRR